ncbi:MAG: periplasmic heavy metal sensor [Nitrosomonadales bacterium]|nr:periplasmic heavy metal sensor [Nitrosomonadales bacterium]
MQTPIQQTRHADTSSLLLSFFPYAIACVVLSALPLFSYAHDAPPGVPPACGRMSGLAMPKDAFPPLPMGMPQPFFAQLDLTDEQQDKVFKLMHDKAPALFENEKIARRAMQELQQLTRSERFDAAKAKSKAEAHGKALAELAYLNTVIQAQIWSVLSAEQRKQIYARSTYLHKK